MPETGGTAVFLGAGASKALDLPLTREILPEILKRLKDGTLFRGGIPNARENRQALEELLRAVLRDEAAKPPLITDLLSLVDHAVLQANPLALEERSVDAAAYRAPRDLPRLRALLERGMYEVLKTLQPSKKEVLQKFAAWIQREAGACERLSIVTTNYDLIPEHLSKHLGMEAADVDFGFPWRDSTEGSLHYRPVNPRLGIYKLHGSLNWLRCALCEHTYINPAGNIAYLGFDPRPSPHNTCHCGYWPLRHVMVAPSMVRDIRDANLLQIWMAALEAMRLAKKWYVIGYSMPAEDLTIRSLLIRAFQARGYRGKAIRPAPEITVVQATHEDAASYRLLFGKVGSVDGGLEGFLENA